MLLTILLGGGMSPGSDRNVILLIIDVFFIRFISILSKVWISRLYQKVGNDPMKDEIVVKTVNAQLQKEANGVRTLLAP